MMRDIGITIELGRYGLITLTWSYGREDCQSEDFLIDTHRIGTIQSTRKQSAESLWSRFGCADKISVGIGHSRPSEVPDTVSLTLKLCRIGPFRRVPNK